MTLTHINTPRGTEETDKAMPLHDHHLDCDSTRVLAIRITAQRLAVLVEERTGDDTDAIADNDVTAFGVNVMGAFRGRGLLFLGFAEVVSCEGALVLELVPTVDSTVGLLFCASTSDSFPFTSPSFLSQGAVGGQVWC